MNKENYSDIHMHVIPYVDDGADDFEDALAMLRIAYEDGIRNVIATPHSGAFDPWRNKVKENYLLLCERIRDEEIGINLMLGAEIRLHLDQMEKILKRIKKGKYPTLNGSEKILIEFQPAENNYYGVAKAIEALINNDYLPIIAHAERYKFSVDQIYRLCECGCQIQINFDDVVPMKGDPMSEKTNIMLKDQMAKYIGTDAHHSYRRTPHIHEALEYLYSEYDESYIDELLSNTIV